MSRVMKPASMDSTIWTGCEHYVSDTGRFEKRDGRSGMWGFQAMRRAGLYIWYLGHFNELNATSTKLDTPSVVTAVLYNLPALLTNAPTVVLFSKQGHTNTRESEHHSLPAQGGIKHQNPQEFIIHWILFHHNSLKRISTPYKHKPRKHSFTGPWWSGSISLSHSEH